jgi:hypothetical protein
LIRCSGVKIFKATGVGLHAETAAFFILKVMKKIRLNHGYVALVDDDDFEYLNKFNWHVFHGRNTDYAQRSININGKWTSIFMHREIINISLGLLTDHADRNGLNNQKYNLRICNESQNNGNVRKIRGKSLYKGVHFNNGKWNAAIRYNKKHFYLGRYTSEIDAAIAYDKKAIELFGEFACINFS